MSKKKELIGKIIGSYKLVQCIDEQGTSAVYLGEHPEIQSRVAVKILLPEFISDFDVVRRFLDEARAQNRIGHPGIIPINDCNSQGDVGLYLVMEYVKGQTLAAASDVEGAFGLDRVGRVVCQAASAMGAAHAAGIVHRKLKPSNIMLAPDPDMPGGERVRIFGFGIAKLIEEAEEVDEETKTGMVLGVPRYASPEQCMDAKSVDLRTDIYALGAIAYELLAGRPPYEAKTFGALVVQQESSAPPDLRALNDDVPEELSAAIHKALAKDREQRYATMAELRDAVSAALPEIQGMVSTELPKLPLVDLPPPMAAPPKTDPPAAAAEPERGATAILDPGPGQAKATDWQALDDDWDTVLQDSATQPDQGATAAVDPERATAILSEGLDSTPLGQQETAILDGDQARVEVGLSPDMEQTVLQGDDQPGAVDMEQTLIEPDAAPPDPPRAQGTAILGLDSADSSSDLERPVDRSLADEETLLLGDHGQGATSTGPAALADQDTVILSEGTKDLADQDTAILSEGKPSPQRPPGQDRPAREPTRKQYPPTEPVEPLPAPDQGSRGLLVVVALLALVGVALGAAFLLSPAGKPAPVPAKAPPPPPPPPPAPLPPPAPDPVPAPVTPDLGADLAAADSGAPPPATSPDQGRPLAPPKPPAKTARPRPRTAPRRRPGRTKRPVRFKPGNRPLSDEL